jgi:CheY-like chemotaxis protein
MTTRAFSQRSQIGKSGLKISPARQGRGPAFPSAKGGTKGSSQGQVRQTIAKPHFLKNCHSERSEESRLFNYLRPAAKLRVTKKGGLKGSRLDFWSGKLERKAMKPCRILLADDHLLVRQGIKRILAEDPDLEVIGEAADGREALKLLEELQPDLVILDIQMPRMGGMEAARRIKKSRPELKVLMLTMHKENEYLRQAREIGVEGFMLKEDVDLALLGAIAAICRGETFVSSLVSN